MKLNGSEILTEVLIEQGVDTVFGYPGGAVLNIYDALYKYSDKIKHILSAHEQGASHAADGYARATDEKDMDTVEVLRGPNIKPFPVTSPLEDVIDCKCSLKVGDNITTDHIMPAGAKILPLRSNIPAISKHCFTVCDENFPERAESLGKSIIVGGANYGQGSSREHAALAPLHLGVKIVITKSFARIHRANLVNAGILPFTFVNENDYDKINEGDELICENLIETIREGGDFVVRNKTTGDYIPCTCELSDRAKDIILAGGLLNYTKMNG